MSSAYIDREYFHKSLHRYFLCVKTALQLRPNNPIFAQRLFRNDDPGRLYRRITALALCLGLIHEVDQ